MINRTSHPEHDHPDEETDPNTNGRLTSVIIRLIPEKSFGFASVGRTNYFFHATEVIDHEIGELRIGMHVRFLPGENPKGPRASDVEVIDEIIPPPPPRPRS